MRLLTMAQPEAWFTALGARPYHAMSSRTDVPQLAAIHAAAEPTSWADIERRIDEDRYFRRCLYVYDLLSREAIADLPRGTIIAVMRVVEVLDATRYADPRLTPIGGKPYLWKLEPVRLLHPVTNVRGWPNFPVMPEELVRRVEEAPTDERTWPDIPAGLGETVYPRGRRRPILDFDPSRDTEQAEALLDAEALEALAERDAFYRTLGDDEEERALHRAIKHYISVLETRGEGWTREVKVDRRVPRLADAFPDRTWVTIREFVRRVRASAIEELEDQLDAREQHIDDIRRAMHEARERADEIEHEYLMLTDEDYKADVELHSPGRLRKFRAPAMYRDSWARALDAAASYRAKERMRRRRESGS